MSRGSMSLFFALLLVGLGGDVLAKQAAPPKKDNHAGGLPSCQAKISVLQTQIMQLQAEIASLTADRAALELSEAACGAALSTSEGSLTACGAALSTSEGSLAGCGAALSMSEGSLTTCSAALSASDGSLTTCGAALSTSEGSLTTCSAALSTSEGSLTACGAALSTSEGSLTACGAALSTSEESLTTCRENLTASEGELDACGGAEYESTAATDRVCTALTICTGSEYESTAATATTDRVCTALTICTGSEYESTAATTTTDRVCTALSGCGANQYESTAPTATSDRVCSECTMVCADCSSGICTLDCGGTVAGLSGVIAAECDGPVAEITCDVGLFDENGDVSDGCEADLTLLTNIEDWKACTSTGPNTCVCIVTVFSTIQSCIDSLSASASPGLVLVESGTYTEDLDIDRAPALGSLDIVSLAGPASTIIVGVATEPASAFPAVTPNIDIKANNVAIRGFTIRSPAVDATEYSGGIVLTGTDIEIFDNLFEVATGNISFGIQTWAGSSAPADRADISGLHIHNNTFTHLSPTMGNLQYEAIYVNPQMDPESLTNEVIIENNTFEGSMFRACTADQRTNVTFQENSVTSTGETLLGSFPRGLDVRASDTLVDKNSFTNLTQAIRLDLALTTNTDVIANNNAITDNTFGIVFSGTPNGFTVNAENNWWGDASGPNCLSCSGTGDSVDDDVDYTPWLSAAP